MHLLPHHSFPYSSISLSSASSFPTFLPSSLYPLTFLTSHPSTYPPLYFSPLNLLSPLYFPPSYPHSLLPSNSSFLPHHSLLPPNLFLFSQVPPALTISAADLSQYSIVVTTMERCAMESRSPSSSILNKIRYVNEGAKRVCRLE